MSEPDTLIRLALERQVPLRLDREPEWRDVVTRASLRRRAPGHRALAAIAVATALVVVASALAAVGHDPFGTISSWLKSAPGEPASHEEQIGFTGRSGASYAAFPAGVDVHRVGHAVAGTKTFTLLGFASGNSLLCLRVTRADSPTQRGTNECVTRDELAASPAPALVATEANFRIATPLRLVDGIFGFADDTVRAIEYRRGRGRWSSVPVANNVFLALGAHAPGTFRHPARSEAIVQVRAVTRSGERIDVPFVAGNTTYTGGVPTGPSYLAFSFARPKDVPGPTAVVRHRKEATVGWLVRGEKRGSAWRPSESDVARLGTLVHSRAIQPDPDDPYRVGLFLVHPRTGWWAGVAAGKLVVCASALRPLGGTDGVSCLLGAADSGALSGNGLWGGTFGFAQRTHVAGAVGDDVASLRLFLASGRVVPVALRDNAYSVSAPSGQFPAKLVAYDDAGRVIGLQMFQGPARPTPCPAVRVWPVSQLPATERYQRLDLGALEVNGSPIFGRSPLEVEAVLGKPSRGAAFSVTNGNREPTFFYGGVLPSSAELTVHFGWHQQRLRADRLDFHGRGLVDAKLGRIFNEQPQAFERQFRSTYGSTFRRTLEYGSLPGSSLASLLRPNGCTGEFRDGNGVVRITFGVEPRTRRSFLSLWHPY